MYKDDLTTLTTVNEEIVLDTLSQRFSQGNIYTFVGDILISINPFHEYPIYSPEVRADFTYRQKNSKSSETVKDLYYG